jgi:adenine deaminase
VALTAEDLAGRLDAALGRKELDLVIANGRLLDVFRGQWIEGDLGISAGRIVSFGGQGLTGAKVIDAGGKWVVPGFFEAHFHAGGSHLSPTRLAEALLARGTTATVCDFQEHYAVAGLDAARYALDEAWAAGLKVYYLAPTQAFVVDQLGVSGRGMSRADMLAMLTWPETVAINEPPPGPVLGKNLDALDVIVQTLAAGKIYSGHAPSFTGQTLQAYVASGASSDHESTRASEAWEKLGLGMAIMMREGSAAPDLAALIALAVENPLATRHMMLVTDEVDPVDLSTLGHMDYKVRRAIGAGVDPVIALQMASLNGAQYYRVDHEVGSLAPGRRADAVILSDLTSVTVDQVIADGQLVDGPRSAGATEYPPGIRSEVRIQRPFRAADFALPCGGATAQVRVVEVRDGSLLSTAGSADVPVVNGSAVAAPDRDILKMAVIDRYTGGGDLAVSFVSGFQIADGAVATTYAHPYYNVLVIGTDDEQMALAANRIAELGGGMAVVKAGEVTREWRLDVVGVFSSEPLETVREEFAQMNAALRDLGCPFHAPVLALSFVALPTIPDYGLTSRGLYDVRTDAFVSPFAE